MESSDPFAGPRSALAGHRAERAYAEARATHHAALRRLVEAEARWHAINEERAEALRPDEFTLAAWERREAEATRLYQAAPTNRSRLRWINVNLEFATAVRPPLLRRSLWRRAERRARAEMERRRDEECEARRRLRLLAPLPSR